MEPRQQDPEKTRQFRPEGQSRPEQRKRRFRIVKLEERIAPKGTGTPAGTQAESSLSNEAPPAVAVGAS
jgi:hypothetical protein